MKKGLVTKIQSNYMLVLTDQMTIEKVKPKPLINVGQRLEYAKNDIYKGVKIFDFKKFSSIVSIFLTLILSSYYFIDSSNATEVYAVVSIDINPSIELLVDKNNVVIDYRAYNEDGKNVLDKSIKNIRVEEAISKVIINAQNLDYLVGRDMILISSSLVSDNSIVDSLNLNDNLKMFMRNNQEKYQFVYIQGSSKNDKAQSIGMQALKDMSENPLKDEFHNLEALVNDVVLKESMDNEKPIELVKDENGKVLVDSFTLTDEKFKIPNTNKKDKNNSNEDVISDSDENQHNVNLFNDNKEEEPKKNDSKEEVKKDNSKEEPKKNDSKEEVKKDDSKEEPKKNDSKEEVKKDDSKEEPKKNDSKEEVKKDDSKEEPKKNDSKEEVKKDDSKEEPKKNDSKEEVKKEDVKKEDSKDYDSKEEDSKEEDSKEEDSKEEDSKEEDSKEEDSKEEDSKEEDSKEEDSKEEDSKDDDSKEEDSKEKDSKEDDSKEEDSKEEDSKEEDSKEDDSKEEDSKEDDSKDDDSKKDDSKYDNEENENIEQKKNNKVEKEKP